MTGGVYSVAGGEITTAHRVHISYPNGGTDTVNLTTDDWGDPAVVVNVEPLADGQHVLLTVAPDDTDTLEYAVADIRATYAVIGGAP